MNLAVCNGLCNRNRVGGPLSHGLIVAREYGLPAVLGTVVATRRIHDGQTIIVDGRAGTVILDGNSSIPYPPDQCRPD